MNTSLFFTNLSDEEICQILSVVSVPYLMEPIKNQPEKYLGQKKHVQSLSREAVNQLYLKFLADHDPVLSLYLSDIVVDIIHYFKLSDAFKTLLTTKDEHFVHELEAKIQKRQCPITVDMFMRLLDKDAKKKEETKLFDIEANHHQNEEQSLKEETESQSELQTKEETEEVDAEVVDEVIEEEKTEDLEKTIQDLQYQLMNLQVENEALKEENRDLLFQNDDESELENLRRDLDTIKVDYERGQKDIQALSMDNTKLQNDLRDFEEYKKKHNQTLLELRDYKIKYISLQAEVDQLRYQMKNDSKKIKELEKKQRSVYDNDADWMMAMHDLTWYKKQWQLPGDVPLHKIWAHLNKEEAKGLAHLLKNYDRMLRAERREAIAALKEILIVKEAILILLRSDKAMEEARQVKKENSKTVE